MPGFEPQVIEETDRYIVARNSLGIVTRALKEGSVSGGRMCMDEHIAFPVQTPADLADIRRRMTAGLPARYPADLDAQIARWKSRDFPLCLGRNCAAKGFYWRARELMGTENLSYAWYDYPDLMHEMMETIADFLIEVSRPVLEKVPVDFFVFNEDLSMKGGPLLSPDTYRTFIFPRMKRVVDFLRRHGTRYVAVDSDGDPTVLIPLFMDAGVDTVWPIERASEVSPQAWRRRFGRSLRLWGGVDKRVLTRGPAAIRAHLREFIPLIEEGGFIPTVDHTVPPDVSWDNFRYYMDAKTALLRGDFAALAG
jgi:uroporphyrinogen decarboxylase